MHEHFDAEGNFTGRTVITREPEWDDHARGQALRLAEHQRSIDRTTGLPMAEAFTEQPFRVHNDAVNYAARAMDKKREADREELGDDADKWLEHRTYYVEAVHPDDLPTPD